MINRLYLQPDSSSRTARSDRPDARGQTDVYRVQTDAGLHVGNLKRIGLVWKFKAIGYTAAGQVVPGGGPLTNKHNAVFTQPDEVEINQALCQ